MSDAWNDLGKTVKAFPNLPDLASHPKRIPVLLLRLIENIMNKNELSADFGKALPSGQPNRVRSPA
jgi:hypothetical protein